MLVDRSGLRSQGSCVGHWPLRAHRWPDRGAVQLAVAEPGDGAPDVRGWIPFSQCTGSRAGPG